MFRQLFADPNCDVRVCVSLISVVQWHPAFPLFGGSPTKNGLPQNGFPFFQGAEQLRLNYVLVCCQKPLFCFLSMRIGATRYQATHVSIATSHSLWVMWVWVKIQPGDGRFWSMFPLTRVPFWVPIFDPQLCVLEKMHAPKSGRGFRLENAKLVPNTVPNGQ